MKHKAGAQLLDDDMAYYDKVEVNEKTKDTDLSVQFENRLNKTSENVEKLAFKQAEKIRVEAEEKAKKMEQDAAEKAKEIIDSTKK